MRCCWRFHHFGPTGSGPASKHRAVFLTKRKEVFTENELTGLRTAAPGNHEQQHPRPGPRPPALAGQSTSLALPSGGFRAGAAH